MAAPAADHGRSRPLVGVLTADHEGVGDRIVEVDAGGVRLAYVGVKVDAQADADTLMRSACDRLRAQPGLVALAADPVSSCSRRRSCWRRWCSRRWLLQSSC